MRLLFRLDVSSKIGTGHLMRCLALAYESKRSGHINGFLLRDPNEYAVDVITSDGHECFKLASPDFDQAPTETETNYRSWLSVSQQTDACDTLNVLSEFSPDWIIVDHYALDETWLSIVRTFDAKVLVIDDLGDRSLPCDILLDQNLGANPDKYKGKLHVNCGLLLGPSFALLRREFKDWRERSLDGRLDRHVENILITLGGVDSENYTLQILKEISKSDCAMKCAFTVLVGGSYPHTKKLHEFLQTSKLKVSVLSNVANMAQIMSESDLCIGAAGSTSWERCCLGLPTITFTIADNQIEIAEQLSQKKVAIFSDLSNLIIDFERFFDVSGKELQRSLSTNSSQICDGLGVPRVLAELEKKFEN